MAVTFNIERPKQALALFIYTLRSTTFGQYDLYYGWYIVHMLSIAAVNEHRVC